MEKTNIAELLKDCPKDMELDCSIHTRPVIFNCVKMESKPNLLQQLKDYFDNTPKEVLEKEWNELSYLNEIGPTVDEYLEYVKKYRNNEPITNDNKEKQN